MNTLYNVIYCSSSFSYSFWIWQHRVCFPMSLPQGNQTSFLWLQPSAGWSPTEVLITELAGQTYHASQGQWQRLRRKDQCNDDYGKLKNSGRGSVQCHACHTLPWDWIEASAVKSHCLSTLAMIWILQSNYYQYCECKSIICKCNDIFYYADQSNFESKEMVNLNTNSKQVWWSTDTYPVI
jgi:hypothetical protein